MIFYLDQTLFDLTLVPKYVKNVSVSIFTLGHNSMFLWSKSCGALRPSWAYYILPAHLSDQHLLDIFLWSLDTSSALFSLYLCYSFCLCLCLTQLSNVISLANPFLMSPIPLSKNWISFLSSLHKTLDTFSPWFSNMAAQWGHPWRFEIYWFF